MGRRDGLPQEAKEFLDYCDATHKQSTTAGYITNLNRFYSFLRKQYPNEKNLFSKIDRPLIQKYCTDLFQVGLQPASRFLALMNLRCYLAWANEMNYIEHDSRDLIQLKDFPKRPVYLPRPIEPNHDKQLINYLKTAKAVTEKGLLILRYTGMRVGELLDLPYNCLHQEDDSSYSIRVPLGKLNNERLVPLTDEALTCIRHMQPDPNRSYLMTSKNGSRYSYSGMRAAMNRACKRADIPYYSIHQLRHTLATSLLNGGASLATVMRILGHKKINMTLRYAKVTQSTVRKQYFDAINAYIEDYDITPYENDKRNPLDVFSDLIRLLEKKRQESKNPKEDNTKVKLIKRLRRLEDDLRHVL